MALPRWQKSSILICTDAEAFMVCTYRYRGYSFPELSCMVPHCKSNAGSELGT
jgi:hypothetical protein